MSLTDQEAGNGPGGTPPTAQEPGSARRRGRFRWWWLLPPAALAVAAAIILTALAATYQPIAFRMEMGGNLIPGLPEAKGLRGVNTFGLAHHDLYLPPQRGLFTIDATITNTGTYAVTIEAVMLPRPGGRYWPVSPAGPVRYSLADGGPQLPTVGLLRNVTLGPGDQINIGIPVRSAPCASKTDWTQIVGFMVRERFLWFTRTVPMPVTEEDGLLIMHTPGGHPGDPNVFCASP